MKKQKKESLKIEKNYPYVKQFDEDGELKNPIVNGYYQSTVFNQNRQARRKAMKKQKPFNNRKSRTSIFVIPAGIEGTYQKAYVRSIQNIDSFEKKVGRKKVKYPSKTIIHLVSK